MGHQDQLCDRHLPRSGIPPPQEHYPQVTTHIILMLACAAATTAIAANTPHFRNKEKRVEGHVPK